MYVFGSAGTRLGREFIEVTKLLLLCLMLGILCYCF